MKPNFSKIEVISFTRKTNVLNYQYRLRNSFVLRTDCIKDLGVHIDCKLHFHHHVDFFFTRNEIIRVNSYNYIFLFYHWQSIDAVSLVRSKLKYTSVAWNSVTIADSNKLERTQRKISALWHSRFFQDVEYHYYSILEKLNLQTLHIRRSHLDALFYNKYL
jgi:hypothetical protein